MKKLIKGCFMVILAGAGIYLGANWLAGKMASSSPAPTVQVAEPQLKMAVQSIRLVEQPEILAVPEVIASSETAATTNKVEHITFRIRPKLGRGTNTAPIQASVN